MSDGNSGKTCPFVSIGVSSWKRECVDEAADFSAQALTCADDDYMEAIVFHRRANECDAQAEIER